MGLDFPVLALPSPSQQAKCYLSPPVPGIAAHSSAALNTILQRCDKRIWHQVTLGTTILAVPVLSSSVWAPSPCWPQL